MTIFCRLPLAKIVAVSVAVAAWLPPAAAQSPAAPVPEPTIDVARFSVTGNNPLDSERTQALLAPLAGSQRTLAQIEAAASALEKALHAEGFAFHRVLVPAQKPKAGEITLQIVHFPLADVGIEGNEHFSADNIRRSLPTLREGEVIDLNLLGRDISAANMNPAKQAAITFKESKQPRAIDAVVKVKDVNPLSVFAGLTTNRPFSPWHGDSIYRLTMGMQHANLFDRDHVATLSYTTDPSHLSAVTLLGAYYQIPFHGTGLNLSAYYTYSDVSSGRVQQGGGFFDVSGRGKFFGTRLTQSLRRMGSLQQNLSIAIDDRFFENSTTFNGAPVQPDVGSRPLSLRYAAHNEEAWGTLAGHVEYAVNLRSGGGNNRDRYLANGGNHDWEAWRYSADLTINATPWQYSARLRGQWTHNMLIPGEQFGLGGSNSVRGFADREVSGDHGYGWSLEAKGPTIFIPHLRPVFFVDGGSAHSRSIASTERLMSIGAGLRWSTRDIDLAADIAHALDRNSLAVNPARSRLHFSLVYRF